MDRNSAFEYALQAWITNNISEDEQVPDIDSKDFHYFILSKLHEYTIMKEELKKYTEKEKV